MKIKKIISQHRRDMVILYKCGHCGHEYEGLGYDDNNFHRNVIPTIECLACGKMGESDYRQLTTKYPEGMTV